MDNILVSGVSGVGNQGKSKMIIMHAIKKALEMQAKKIEIKLENREYNDELIEMLNVLSCKYEIESNVLTILFEDQDK